MEDGAIHGVGVTKGYGYLMTEKHYKDFELAIRFQCVTGGNSGVFYRTSFKPGTADVAEGYQFEIDRNLMHHTGGIYTARRGWIVWPSPENELVVKPTDWNDYVLTVVGNHHRARLERGADDRLYRPGERSGRRRDRAATTRGRRSQHALQGYLYSRLFGAMKRRANPRIAVTWNIIEG